MNSSPLTARILFQPKQERADFLISNGNAKTVGLGGGRGGAKTAGLIRSMIKRRLMLPGTIGVMVMRNYTQIVKFHIVPMLNDFPQLRPYYEISKMRIVFPAGVDSAGNVLYSTILFMYAENLHDVEIRFKSANFYDVFVDQAEQFDEAELREMKQTVRWKNVPMGACKFVLAFNMGGIGIDFLRKKFHLKEYNAGESEADYAFVHFYPWDNVEWCRPQLATEGLGPKHYYTVMTEQERMHWCATRSDYGKVLTSQDEALVKRDWLGSWEALEGAFFGRVFSSDARITQEQQAELIKPW